MSMGRLHCKERGHVPVVEILLDHGARLSTNALADKTELQLAAGNGHVAVVRLLLERGADKTVKTIHGFTVLDIAAAMKYENVAQLLLQSQQKLE